MYKQIVMEDRHSMTVPINHLSIYCKLFFCLIFFIWSKKNCNSFSCLVPKVGCAHKCASGWASDTPAGKRRGSMQGVLQSSSLACRGSLLQPAYTAPPQRLVPYSWFTLLCVKPMAEYAFARLLHFGNTHCVAYSSIFTYHAHSHLSVFSFADLIDPLTYRPVYHQKYVLNERGKTLIQNKTKLVLSCVHIQYCL